MKNFSILTKECRFLLRKSYKKVPFVTFWFLIFTSFWDGFRQCAQKRGRKDG